MGNKRGGFVKKMERVFFLNSIRSYIGIENGAYRHICAEQLGAFVLKKAAEPYCRDDFDLIIAGNAAGAGGNIARLMALEAGMPESLPAITVDLQCASGLESIAMAAAKIKSGQADLIIAGGFESSSTAPRRSYHKNHPDYERYGGEQGFYHVAKFAPGEHTMTAMLNGAEKTASFFGMERKTLDQWALRSHRLAKKAREDQILQDMLVEVEGACKKDEGIRDTISMRLLERLPGVVKNGSLITAGNACLTNDGAAFSVLCSERYLKHYGFSPKAEFIDSVLVGTDPSMSPQAANAAIKELLLKNKLSVEEIDVFECNEAFSVIDELFARQYPQAVERYNIFGGALAYGHPYGASGGVIVCHAIRALEKTGGGLAVCSIAAAGGIGEAVLIAAPNYPVLRNGTGGREGMQQLK